MAFNIPKTTLKDQGNCSHGSTPGKPQVLDRSEKEAIITEMVNLLSEWGFPSTDEDLWRFVKFFEEKRGL